MKILERIENREYLIKSSPLSLNDTTWKLKVILVILVKKHVTV